MKYIIDTHALVWYLIASPKLGANAKAALDSADNSFVIPATALAETCWIVEKGRIPSIASSSVILAALDGDARFSIAPLDRATVERSNTLHAIGEMHDRQIAATALLLIEGGEAVSLITHDSNITGSGVVPVVW
jgi:PIN domain nuclease of toxin-antitoxin system